MTTLSLVHIESENYSGAKPQKGFQVLQERHSVDQIIPSLRRAAVELGKGATVPEVCKLLGITEQTYDSWRQKYGPDMVAELKTLQEENTQLKKMVAEQALHLGILKEAVKGNW